MVERWLPFPTYIYAPNHVGQVATVLELSPAEGWCNMYVRVWYLWSRWRNCVCVCEGGPKTKTRRIGRRTGTSWTGWITLVVIFGWWIAVAETKGFGNEETMCIMKS